MLFNLFLVSVLGFFRTSKNVYGQTIQIRLVGGSSKSNGRVEIFYNNTWGTVCDDNWDDNDARVVAKMLGYVYCIAFPKAKYGIGSDKIWLDDVNCNGKEFSLVDCSRNPWGVHDCTHAEDAGVHCSSDEFNIRLVEGTSESNGRLEIKFNNQWGTVCDDNWDDNDARVVCRMLRYKDGIAFKDVYHGMGYGNIWLDEFNCNGRERSLIDCPRNPWGDHDCSHNEDAGVYCIRNAIPIRLVGGNSTSSGRVEINLNNKWGTVCDDNWDDSDARVVCRMLGYNDGIAVNAGQHGMGSGDIWLDEVGCNGTESSLTDCTKNPWGFHDCSHSEDAGVHCIINAIPIRLGGGNSTSVGRVEIKLNHKWGTICNNNWDDNDARVVCRMLGYNYGVALYISQYEMGSGDIWLDEVDCNGTETSLVDCPKNPWGIHNCHRGEVAGVHCSRNATRVRLVGGNSENTGRVEILYNGQWGTVCDDSWDDRDARVICKMLGYDDGRASGQVPKGIGPIWLDQVECQGNELSVTHCKKNNWGIHDCSHIEDVGVVCENALRIQDSRIRNDTYFYEGRLELKINNVWGTVCYDKWSGEDITVACRMLGFSDGMQSMNPTVINGTEKLWMINVICNGTEIFLSECTLLELNVPCTSTLSVLCIGTGIQQARLVGRNDSASGRLEVMIKNVWGSLCDDKWTDMDATTTCLMLGFSRGVASTEPMLANDTGKVWMMQVECNKFKRTLTYCEPERVNAPCSNRELARVQCF